jgi:hypothetical protein
MRTAGANMHKSKIDLAHVHIAAPCPISWDDLTGDERKRFCAQCGLNVYNISAMTKAEAESFVGNAEGRVCAKIYRRADGAILTRDCPVGLRVVRKRVARALAAAFSALVSMFGGTMVFAQQEQHKNDSKAEVQRTLRRDGQASVVGTIYDILHVPVAFAEVKLVNEETKREITTRSNENGKFRVMELTPGLYTIQIGSPGFRILKLSGINVTEDEALNLAAALEVGEFGGLGVVASPLPTNDTPLPGELKRKERPRE